MNTTVTTIDPVEDVLDGDSATTARPLSRRKWFRRIATGIVLLALIPAGGAFYEATASLSDATSYPAPGRLIDVGGYKLHLHCEGMGKPAVILDAGLGKSSLDWSLVQSRLATSTEVCSFDRAGMGWSEPGPLPRTPQANADDLSRLLDAGGVTGPYILVGHSLAGKNARLFAAAHPSDVAGMVLVDARSEWLDIETTSEELAGFVAALEGQGAVYTLARRLGIVRMFGAALAGAPLPSPETAQQMALLETSPNAVATTIEEGKARGHDDAVLAAATLGNLPLVVIAAADSMSHTKGWPAAQNRLARLSGKGRLVIAAHSSHAIHLDEPDVVIDAVTTVLADARQHN